MIRHVNDGFCMIDASSCARKSKHFFNVISVDFFFFLLGDYSLAAVNVQGVEYALGAERFRSTFYRKTRPEPGGR